MTDTFHLAIPQFQSVVIIMFRTAGILAAMPVLGSRTIPPPLKVALVVLVGLVLTPLLPAMALPSDPLLVAAGLAGEVMIGLLMGLAVRLLFAALEVAGDVIGTQMGFSVAHLIDPLSAQQTPLMASFQTVLATLTFLSLNAHYLMVRSVAASFEAIPPFTARLSGPLAEDVLHLTQEMFVIALKLAAPILATILIINAMMAVLGRTVPQLNVFVMSFPLTIAAGMAVMALALPYTIGLYESEFVRLEDRLEGLLRMLGHG
ncbi:MAG TPA: flagellar biosynthetic protein FliR [Nitrospira sp.]|nr:flagellar biosynthetic protein FliR [Nitrospira sp.]